MNIVSKDAWTLQFKTRQTTVEAGRQLLVDTVLIDGPGEYDVAGVAIQGIKTDHQTLYVMIIEEMRICMMPQVPEPLSTALLEIIGGVDIAVVPLVAQGTLSDAMGAINALEPRMAVLIGDGDMAAIPRSAATLDLPDIYKVTKPSLPLEDRILLLNHA